jgi:hypothetical protein
MKGRLIVQGRELEAIDIDRIRQMAAENPTWSRRRLSQAIAVEWDWRNAAGQLKDMAARSLLLKLHQRGEVQLPPRRQTPTNRMGRRVERLAGSDWDCNPLTATLSGVGLLRIREVSAAKSDRQECASALERFHYLGWRGGVGENLIYAVHHESGRLLSCVVFGAAAWKCAARDGFIGWSADQRQRHLHQLANNTRFLILPFVRIPHLASWILGQVLRRLSADWKAKYGHSIILAETFVDRSRFQGTCYRAANWIWTGATTGRSRQDRSHTLQVPVKDVYIYPLHRRFRQKLCGERSECKRDSAQRVRR